MKFLVSGKFLALATTTWIGFSFFVASITTLYAKHDLSTFGEQLIRLVGWMFPFSIAFIIRESAIIWISPNKISVISGLRWLLLKKKNYAKEDIQNMRIKNVRGKKYLQIESYKRTHFVPLHNMDRYLELEAALNEFNQPRPPIKSF